MFTNNFRIIFRSISKNKGFTFLNVFGLALGLGICLLVLFYVIDEISYDKYNTKADRIFRVNTDAKFGDVATSFAIAAPSIAEALKNSFPEVQQTVRLLPDLGNRFIKGNEVVQEDKVVYSDPDIFKIFTLPMLAGDSATALTEPNTAVITESTAKKYFQTTQSIGKVLTIVSNDNHNKIFKITGIIRDVPGQSHFHFDIFLSMASLPISHNPNYFALFPFNTYILLNQEADYKNLEKKFSPWVSKSLAVPQYNYDEFVKSGNYYRLSLIPLEDIHLHSNRTNEIDKNGDIQYVYIFSCVAVLLLLIACINFINLSTAGSFKRAREISIRKVLGSPRKNLVFQFLTESVMLTLFATLIAVFTCWLLLPVLNQLSGKALTLTVQTLTWLLPSLLITVILVGLLAGLYPAFILSAFQPINGLKSNLSTGLKKSGFKSLLVVVQFSISIFLVIGTLVIYNQLRYIRSKDIGYNREGVLVIKNVDALANPKVFKQEVKQLSGVVNATLSRFRPTGTDRWHNFGNSRTSNTSLQTEFWTVDEDYLNTMNMRLVKGRNFLSSLSTDSSGIIINETAAKLLGYSNQALSKKIYYGRKQKEYQIIGIVKDFNFNSLRDNITPLVLVLNTPLVTNWAGTKRSDLNIRVNSNNVFSLLTEIEHRWQAGLPGQHFAYSFMDDDYNAIYRDEQHMGEIFIIFTTLAIIIACFGLFGLTLYIVEQRKKEISIRKVLGADVTTIVTLISKEFVKLIIIAACITSPVSWLIMQQWLQNFAYHETLNGWIFPIAGITALLIALITISFQSIKAALTNPVGNLRSE